MPTLVDDYSFQFGDTGTILNTDDMSLPFIDVTQVTGLDAAPQRSTTDEHQGLDGTYIDNPYMSMRTVVVTGNLYTDPADPDTLLNQLRADYNASLVRPFYFQLPGQVLKYVNAGGGGLQYNIDTNRNMGITAVQFTVLAGDPYIYDYPPQVSSAVVPLTFDIGAGFNMGFNVGFGGSIPVSAVSGTNYGTHTAYPVLTIAGPVVNPVLADAFGITMAFSTTLAAGDLLVVDCRNKSVVLNGTVSRRTTLAGLKWFSVPKGMTESVAFSADSGTGTLTMSLSSTYY
jgi:hypothetical protein